MVVKPLSRVWGAGCCITAAAHGCGGGRSYRPGSRLPMRPVRVAGRWKVHSRHGARRRCCSARLEGRRDSLRWPDPRRGVPNQEGGGQCWIARTGDVNVFSLQEWQHSPRRLLQPTNLYRYHCVNLVLLSLAIFWYCSFPLTSGTECHLLKSFKPFIFIFIVSY